MSIVYVIFVALCCYYSYKYDGIEGHDAHKSHRFWLMCIYLICLAAFSYGLGGDKFTYMEEFDNYPEKVGNLKEYISLRILLYGQMPLWTIINLLCKKLFDSFYAVQFIEAVFINCSVCHIAQKYTHRHFLFLIVYFFTFTYFMFNTEIMREAFALSLCLPAFDAWMENRKIRYLLLVSIGLTFHISALIALLFPIVRIKYSNRAILWISAISLGVWATCDIVMGKIILAALGSIGSFAQKIVSYGILTTSFFGWLRSLLLFLVFPFIVYYFTIKWEKNTESKEKMLRLYSYQMVLGFIATTFVGLSRFNNYCVIFYLTFLSNYLYNLFKHKEHLIIRLGNAIAIFAFVIWTYGVYWPKSDTYYFELWYPYTTVGTDPRDVEYRIQAHGEATSIEDEGNNIRTIE